MPEIDYDIIKELPKVTHKYKIGQEVFIISGTKASRERITGMRIDIDEDSKKIIYIFGEIYHPGGGQVGREEKDVWEFKKDLVDAIFEL